MPEPIWPDEAIFRNFTIIEETFKTVDEHEITTAILIPKTLKPGPHPVLLNIHGGFLAYGHSLFAPFFAPWVLKLALENSAIVVSPNYRLLPSKNGVADLLEDLEDFWQWMKSSAFSGVLARKALGHSVDMTKVLLAGGSAGGFCAFQLALSHPDEISAVAVAYPFVDPKDHIMVTGPKEGEPAVLAFPLEDLPSKDAVLEWIKDTKSTVRTSGGFDITPFGVAAAQYGLFYSHVFDSENLDRVDFSPLERLKAGAKVPKKIWIIHGDEDSCVHIRTVDAFVDHIQEHQPDVDVRFDIAVGEDHAFDLIKTSWELHAIGAMDFVRDSWLKG